MKFKAVLTADGLSLLDKSISQNPNLSLSNLSFPSLSLGFLPALDKIGRISHVYLTPSHLMLLHSLLPSDGAVQCVSQFLAAVLFHDYRVSSQNENRIAFAVDLALLHRALRSAAAIVSRGDSTSVVVVKLVKKLPAGSQMPAPYLSFETKGYKSAVIHDVLISKPLSRDDVMELQGALDAAQNLPQTLVQVPDLVQLQNLVDRLKNVGDLLSVSITQYGDLHLQVSTSLVTVGSEFRNLRVLGVRADAPVALQNLSAATRSDMAIQRGEAQSVQVSMKHLAKSLQCQLSKPDLAFYGIAPMGSCLTMIFQFFVAGTRQTDKSISLYCRLPVLDPGSS